VGTDKLHGLAQYLQTGVKAGAGGFSAWLCRSFLIVALCCLFVWVACFRLRVFLCGEILSYSWLVSRNAVPYRDFFDLHFPGAYLLTGTVFGILGDDLVVARLMVAVVAGSAVVVTYILAATLCGSRRVGVLAAAFFAVWGPRFGINGLYYDNFLVVLYPLAAILLYTDFQKKRSMLALIGAGLVLGGAVCFKQHALVGLGCMFVVVTVINSGLIGGFARDVARPVLFVTAGLLPLAGLCAYLTIAGGDGTLMRMLRATIVFSLVEARNYSYLDMPLKSFLALLPAFLFVPIYLKLALWPHRGKGVTRGQGVFLGVWLLVSLSGVIHQARTHLLGPALPFLSVAGGMVLGKVADCLWGWLKDRRGGTWALCCKSAGMSRVMLGFCLLGIVAGVGSVTILYTNYWGEGVIFSSTPTHASSTIADRVADVTSPSDRIFVLGTPEIYYLSRRMPSAPYVQFKNLEVISSIAVRDRWICEIMDSLAEGTSVVVMSEWPPYYPVGTQWPYAERLRRFVIENFHQLKSREEGLSVYEKW